MITARIKTLSALVLMGWVALAACQQDEGRDDDDDDGGGGTRVAGATVGEGGTLTPTSSSTGGASCSCVGNFSGIDYALQGCGAVTDCTIVPGDICPTDAWQLECTEQGIKPINILNCTPAAVAVDNCGSCTSSNHCKCFKNSFGDDVGAACYNGRCIVNCSPGNPDYVEAVPDDGAEHGQGYCDGSC